MFPMTTKGGGMNVAFPDVCKTPAPPAPFVPIPYPNLATPMMASGGSCSKKVKVCNMKVLTTSSEISRSNGDEAGTLKGMVSMTNMDKAKYSVGSPFVKVEGSAAVTWLKPTRHNGSNANAPPGVQVAPSQPVVILSV